MENDEIDAYIGTLIEDGVIKVFENSAKTNNISELVQSCTTIPDVINTLVVEYYKTHPAITTDHTLYTVVTENKSLMNILGIIDPFLYNEKHNVMIMDNKWMNLVDDIDNEVRKERMEAHLESTPPRNPIKWNVDLDKIAERLRKKNQSIYGDLDEDLSFSM